MAMGSQACALMPRTNAPCLTPLKRKSMKRNNQLSAWLRTVCVAAVTLFSLSVMAQEPVVNTPAHMPSYKGGDAALMKFICDNVKYPKEAEQKKKEGRVIVEMIVEKDGSLSDIKVAKSADPLLDEEALRVVGLTDKKWTPAKEKGKTVRSKFCLPVTFRLK